MTIWQLWHQIIRNE